MDLWKQDATDLAAGIAKQECSSREVVEAHLARIEEVNGGLNAITAVLADTALEAADAADRAVANGEELGPLHGVPFTVKENVDLAGSATTQGVAAFAEMVPPLDAPHVARLKAAGGVPLARTNLPDFALRWHTTNDLHGPTRNPWDPSRTPGGSSGGEAASLATGMTPFGVGNDLGGSLRVPSRCCGTAALKPTYGRIPNASSLEPQDPFLSIQLMGVQGPMARRVRDLRLGLEVMAGRDPRDPHSLPIPLGGPAPEPPVRVMVVTDPSRSGADPAVVEAVRRAADALADAGYAVEDGEPPRLGESRDVWASCVVGDAHALMPLLGGFLGEEGKRFLDIAFEARPPTDAAGIVSAYIARHGVAREWTAFQEEQPLVLGPVSSQQPFEVGRDLKGVEAFEEILASLTLTVAGNLLGLPSVAMPTGVADGLPQGVQILGPAFREDLCLDAAEVIEQRLGVITPIDPRR